MTRVFKTCIGSKIPAILTISVFVGLGVYLTYAFFSTWYSPEIPACYRGPDTPWLWLTLLLPLGCFGLCTYYLKILLPKWHDRIEVGPEGIRMVGCYRWPVTQERKEELLDRTFRWEEMEQIGSTWEKSSGKYLHVRAVPDQLIVALPDSSRYAIAFSLFYSAKQIIEEIEKYHPCPTLGRTREVKKLANQKR